MKKLVLAFTALSLIAGPSAALAKGPCKDKHGKFVKCPKVCRNAKGHFIKCR